MTSALTDATIREVLLGVVGNGLWSLVASSGARAFREVQSLISPPQPSIIGAIRTAADRLNESLGSRSKPGQERLMTYLKSPEVESIVRQLFATSLLARQEGSTRDSVKREFISSMSRHLDIDELRLQSFAERFLDGIIASVEDSLRAAIEKNVLSAHEASSAGRHRMLLDEVSNLQKNLSFLVSRSLLDVPAILEFEKSYRNQVGYVHAHIKPPHLESGTRVPIDEIFVAPSISGLPRPEIQKPKTVALQVFLSQLYRAVLLGNPGGGKSTTSTKICYDLATRYSDRLFAGREVTPVLVTLREYGGQKKTTNCSIIQFVEQQATSRYQLKPPANAFEYLLLNGRLLIVFDGLDELLDTSYRQEITSNVEAFCRLYPSVPVLVTSREVGYEQAPLDEKVFEVFRLAPFDEEQVHEYASKWFARDEVYSPEQNIQKARAFFSESAFVPDLRSNPLMLGLMCNLYRAEGYIPRNRPEVYGKCAVMLFERWDKSRDILVPVPFEEHIRPAMQDLAFWVYSNEHLQGGVTEHALSERTSDYLCNWVFDDVPKARSAASGFIAFCTGRAWVFTDTGTTREGERLFQFTHRTFLEYFTACYLVSVHPTPQRLMDSLRTRVAKGEWDVVAQLAFQIQSRQVHGAADALLSLLLANPPADESDLWNILSFAGRSLEFLVPSPNIRREVTRAALAFWLVYVRQDSRRKFGALREARRDITEHIGNLLLATSENRDTIADEIELFLTQSVVSAEADVSALAAELTLDLTHSLDTFRNRRQVTGDVRDYWKEVSGRIIGKTITRILEIARCEWVVALNCFWGGLMTLSEGISVFGVRFLLVSVRSVTLGNVWFHPPGYLYIESVFGMGFGQQSSREERERRAGELESLVELFLRTPTPWVMKADQGDGRWSWWAAAYLPEQQEDNIEWLPLSADASFAILCILAAELERATSRTDRDQVEGFLRREGRIPWNLRMVLLGRFSVARRSESLTALESFAFNSDQRDFLARWINGYIHTVERAVRSRPHRPATADVE
jgi:hypothetical protein